MCVCFASNMATAMAKRANEPLEKKCSRIILFRCHYIARRNAHVVFGVLVYLTRMLFRFCLPPLSLSPLFCCIDDWFPLLSFWQVVHSRRDSDAGIYWCEAENDWGIARSRNATLQVAGKLTLHSQHAFCSAFFFHSVFFMLHHTVFVSFIPLVCLFS